MKKSTKIITAVILTVGVAGAATAYGKHKFGDPSKRADRMAEYIADELELDATQNQALEVLKDELMSKREIMRNQLSPIGDEVEALVSAEAFDQAKALDLLNARIAAVNENAPEIITALGGFLDSLDADQRAEVVEFINKRGDHGHRGRHGRFGKHQDE